MAGAKLGNIVIDNPRAGQELIKANSFRSKVTFIPIDGIVVRLPDPESVTFYHQMSEGRARIAIELVEFDPKYTKVMQFVFGNVFVTDDNQIAKQISGGRSGKKPMTCVTLQGDKYETTGALHGGSLES